MDTSGLLNSVSAGSALAAARRDRPIPDGQVPGPPVHRVAAPSSGPRHGLWANIKTSALAAPQVSKSPGNQVTGGSATPPQIRSAEHQALFEDVLSRTAELDRLIGAAEAIARRRQELAGQLRPGDAEPVRELWSHAVEVMDDYLGQPLSLGREPQGLTLLSATDTFRHWAQSVQRNARGSGGEPILDSPDRLAKLLGRMTDVTPSLSVLVEQADRLLADGAYTLDRLAEQAAARAVVADQLARRQVELAAATQILTTQLGPRLAALRSDRMSRLGVLAGLADNNNSSSELTSEARAGIHELEAIDVDGLEDRLRAIGEWVDTYASDPSLTPTVITHRIATELEMPLQQAELRLAQLASQYQPEQLTQAEVGRQQAQFAALGEHIEAQLAALRQRYQRLVDVRRHKLGSEPDERYDGAIAKTVNDSISQLGAQENTFLDLQSKVGSAAIDSYSSLRAQVLAQTASVRTLLAKSERFASDESLEDTLAAAWQEVLRPLQLRLQQTREQQAQAQALLGQFQDHPGLTDSVRTHIETLLAALARAASEAEQFTQTAHQATSSQRAHFGAATKAHERDLERALGDLAPLNSRETFQSLLADAILQKELAAEARAAEQDRAEQAARGCLDEQLRALSRRRQRMSERLRAALGYAAALEPLEPVRASRIYEQLDAVVTLPLALPLLASRTIGEAFSQSAAWQAFEQAALGGGESFRAIELTVSQLDVLLGPGGRLTEVLAALETQASREPLHRYQSLARTRAAIEQTLQRATGQLATLDAEQLSAAPTSSQRGETDYRAERAAGELRQIGTELGRVRSLLSTAGSENLAGAESLLAEARQLVTTANEDLAAAAARHEAQQTAASDTRDSAATRHRLREKLQAVLTDRPDSTPTPPEPIVTPAAAPESFEVGGDTASTDKVVSIPIHRNDR